jgi:hypothetical protein
MKLNRRNLFTPRSPALVLQVICTNTARMVLERLKILANALKLEEAAALLAGTLTDVEVFVAGL